MFAEAGIGFARQIEEPLAMSLVKDVGPGNEVKIFDPKDPSTGSHGAELVDAMQRLSNETLNGGYIWRASLRDTAQPTFIARLSRRISVIPSFLHQPKSVCKYCVFA